ncbi:nuclear transport factor 2 family protein [Alishewanella sp. d11]|uniref:nuclear transport factor 2 family protein n=1 Tax=Alishewanella sp. d11 TaxID=3414030 RepID=UPI003BF8B478
MISELFKSIDAKDISAFTDFLNEDVIFCFANWPQVDGKANVTNAVNAFLQSIAAIEHQVLACWQPDDMVICRGLVTYTRHDHTTLTVPFANILQILDGEIIDYRIFADISEL